MSRKPKLNGLGQLALCIYLEAAWNEHTNPPGYTREMFVEFCFEQCFEFMSWGWQ